MKIELAGIWLVMFVVLKTGSALLAGWSWWWLLMPIVPDVVVILRHFGVL